MFPATVNSGQLTTVSDAPGQSAEAVSPTNDLAVGPYRGLWIGGTGDVTVICVRDDTAVTFVAVPAGTYIPVAVKEVRATGTSATNIVGIA